MTEVAETVSKYLQQRKLIEDTKARQKEELEVLEQEFEVLEGQLLHVCNEVGASTIKTEAGTIMRSVRSRYWTNDWPSMYDTIREFNAPFLLEQRIHNGNMKQFLEENPEAVPSGLQADKKFVIQVRKPTAK